MPTHPICYDEKAMLGHNGETILILCTPAPNVTSTAYTKLI